VTALGKRVALVLKRSTWRVYVEEEKDALLEQLLERHDPTVARLRASHEEHEHTVTEVKDALAALDAETTVMQNSEPFDGDAFDLVVTVGGDGTLLSASHHVARAPVLGINSAPSHSVGFFCGAQKGDAQRALAAALEGSLERTVLTRMKVCVNGAVVHERVLNDALFCHALPAATSRYILELDGVVEEQKSSGLWIGPAAGSTAAQRSAGGRILPLTSKQLQLVVREPYTPHDERYQLRRALVSPGHTLIARSKTREAKLFFDGPAQELDVQRGDVIEFTRADQSLTLLGISRKRKRSS